MPLMSNVSCTVSFGKIMNGIFYSNTIATLPGWVEPLHFSQPIGYAYETATHFVHLYGL